MKNTNDYMINLPNEENLHIEKISRLFQNTSECYKLFWFSALIEKVDEAMKNGNDGLIRVTFSDLINEMIAEAWYMVLEYNLKLGPADNLEKIIKLIGNITNFKSSEKKEVILNYLRGCTDKEVLKIKKDLIKNVPYRIHSPFMSDFKEKDFNEKLENRMKKINKHSNLLYYYLELDDRLYNGLKSTIVINEHWRKYFVKNMKIVKGWVKYNLIDYLQRKNPNVPGIINKLYPPSKRQLKEISQYWGMIAENQEIHEIYGKNLITKDNISIDHFIPWQYVAHDEMWNLHPTLGIINSSKNNRLPKWESYYEAFIEMEYVAYQSIWKSEIIHKQFDKCAEKHINAPELKEKLYREGMTDTEFKDQLTSVIEPIYKSAKNNGFQEWSYTRG